MKKLAILILVFSLNFFVVNAQNVGIGTDSPHVSAKLEVSSNNSGFLPPRMTTSQRNTIANPVAGLQIYNTTTDCLEIFSKGRWQKMFCGVEDTTTTVDSTLLTDIDGHTYPTVKICNQTWMAKNLDVARYRNGDIIPQVTDVNEWANLTTGAWCWYNNDSATYGSVYGRLYNWYAVNDPRGLAPEGWHVPSDGEWNKMTKCLDENADTTCSGCSQSSIVGGSLKEIGIEHWISPNLTTTSVGFNGLAGGYRVGDGYFYSSIGIYGYWWSSTISNLNSGWSWSRFLKNDISDIYRNYDTEFKDGFSVRCVKDTLITTTTVDSTLLADIDGHTYPTVKICNQTWMAKNLDVARYRNGDIIPQVTDTNEWANLTTGAWCWYNNDSATYGSVYGRLYNWYAVNDPRGLAPGGWHVPSDGEWTTLTDCLGGADVAGGKMKEAGTAHWNSPNTGATNSSGFNAIPGGGRYYSGDFHDIKTDCPYWSSTESTTTKSFYRDLSYTIASVIKLDPYKEYGYYIRCVKDVPPSSTIDSGLVAYYSFNGNANDESGNGNNGTVNGASLTTDRFGDSGKAYSFDGVDDYIEIPSNSKFDNLNEITISSWISINSWCTPNVNGVEFFPILVQYAVPQMQYGKFGLQLTKANESGFYFNSQIFDYNQNNINYWAQTQWIHVCVSASNGIGKWYVNGINVNTINASNIGSALSGLPILIGKQLPDEPSDYHTNGKIDDIRIYNRALSQEEITYLATH